MKTFTLLACALLLVGCARNDTVEEPPATTEDGSVAGDGECQDATTAEGQADLEMQDFVFAPPCLQMGTGQGLRLHNEGEAKHNFSVEDVAGLDVDIGPGEENNTEPTGLEEGTYTFFCKYHRTSHDMQGELRVMAE